MGPYKDIHLLLFRYPASHWGSYKAIVIILLRYPVDLGLISVSSSSFSGTRVLQGFTPLLSQIFRYGSITQIYSYSSSFSDSYWWGLSRIYCIPLPSQISKYVSLRILIQDILLLLLKNQGTSLRILYPAIKILLQISRYRSLRDLS